MTEIDGQREDVRDVPVLPTRSMPERSRRTPAAGPHQHGQPTLRAARRMTFVILPGCERYEACEESISVVCAPARLAMNRCASAGKIWSWRPTRYQVGIVFQAGFVIF